MLTQMSEETWDLVVEIFRQVRPRRGDKGRNDRKFLQGLHFFCVHNITWRALPAEFGHWNSIWKRFRGCRDPAPSRRFSRRWRRAVKARH